MSYLMDIRKCDKKALEYFCKAKLFNPNNGTKVEDIITTLKPINNNSIRVVHGTIEIANQMNTIAKGLREIGINVETLDYYPNYLGHKSDYIVNINSFKNISEANTYTKNLASKLISENDIFHFHFGTSLTLDNSDLNLLNNLGKKVIMQHWGSDVRLYSESVKRSPYVKVKQPDENKIKRNLEFLSTYISHCAVSDYEIYEYVKGYYDNIHFIPLCIDLKKFEVSNKQNEKLLIVHAPTNREVKGTEYILKAINDLKLSYDFEFKLVEHMSYEEAMQTYKNADIIIDQILIGSHGLLAVESMALGKPVICFINEYMKEKYPSELPIISAGVENIKEKLKYLIKNRDTLSQIGVNGRKYVEKYHDINIINSQIAEIYKKI
jgi:glycosyltransferase involved in cell wall biosynthesis